MFIATDLIEERTTGTGYIYYVEAFDMMGNHIYQASWVSAAEYASHKAIVVAQIITPFTRHQDKNRHRITEWRVQALPIDTSAGIIIDG